MVVSMETRKIPEKLRQEFSEIDEFGTQLPMFLENYLSELLQKVRTVSKFDNALTAKD